MASVPRGNTVFGGRPMVRNPAAVTMAESFDLSSAWNRRRVWDFAEPGELSYYFAGRMSGMDGIV
jgi:hypothetical protein